MIVDRPIDVGGAVTFGEFGTTNRQKLLDGLRPFGASLEKFVPAEKSGLACLRRAVTTVLGMRQSKKERVMVRPLARKANGYTVIVEDPGETGNEYANRIVARLVGGDDEGHMEIDPYPGWETMERIRDEFRAAKATLSAATVSQIAGRIIQSGYGVTLSRSRARVTQVSDTEADLNPEATQAEVNDGQVLRGKGIYWLNRQWVDGWMQVARAIEAASSERSDPNAVYVLRVIADEDMVRAVGDALTVEIEHEVESLMTQLARPEIGRRFCENREKEATALLAKVEHYTEALKVPFEKLRDQITSAAQSAHALAQIKASASIMAECAA